MGLMGRAYLEGRHLLEQICQTQSSATQVPQVFRACHVELTMSVSRATLEPVFH